MNTLTIEERNALVLENISLAEKIARSKKKKLSHISLEELKSAAYLGLVEAASKYNPDENDCFPAFAVWRIIGAVRDYLREISWGPRSNPSIAYDLDHYVDHIVYSPEMSYTPSFENIIEDMSDVGKCVLRQYYQEDMKIKEIAHTMGVHQSRVSQILSESRSKLRSLLKDKEYMSAA